MGHIPPEDTAYAASNRPTYEVPGVDNLAREGSRPRSCEHLANTVVYHATSKTYAVHCSVSHHVVGLAHNKKNLGQQDDSNI